MEEEAPRLFEALETEFRRRLGQEEPSAESANENETQPA